MSTRMSTTLPTTYSDDAGNGTAVTTTGSAAGSTAKYAAIGGIALIGVLAVTKMGKRKA